MYRAPKQDRDIRNATSAKELNGHSIYNNNVVDDDDDGTDSTGDEDMHRTSNNIIDVILECCVRKYFD